MLKIRWHGHSCFEIKNNSHTLVTDPHDGRSIGIPEPNAKGDIILVSHNHYDHNSVKTVEKKNSIIIDEIVKKTISDIKIEGIKSFHDQKKGEKRGENRIYRFVMDDISFCHLGDLGHNLDKKSLEKIGEVDFLFIPVGGTFTIEVSKAWKIIKSIQPKIAVPMHYKIGGLSIPINGIEGFLEETDYKIFKVGNEIEVKKEDLPDETEIWTFTL